MRNLDAPSLPETGMPIFLSRIRPKTLNDGEKIILSQTRSEAGPSWRMVVELAERPSAAVVYPGGQSGNPGRFFLR